MPSEITVLAGGTVTHTDWDDPKIGIDFSIVVPSVSSTHNN